LISIRFIFAKINGYRDNFRGGKYPDDTPEGEVTTFSILHGIPPLKTCGCKCFFLYPLPETQLFLLLITL